MMYLHERVRILYVFLHFYSFCIFYFFAYFLRYIMQRQFRPKTPRGEPRDSHGQTLFMCKIKGFYCILVMHIVIFKIETPPPFSHSRGLVVK